MRNKRLFVLMILMIIGLFSVAYAETAAILSEADNNLADSEILNESDIPVLQPSAEVKPAPVPAPVPAPPALPTKGDLLNWWKGGNQAIPVGKPITMVDVWTGKSFKAIRTYGHNHADMEAASYADAQKMKEIWGGTWSWERRPFIAIVNDKNIAVSCAGMPHAGLDKPAAEVTVKNRSGGFGTGLNLDKIKGNGMEGHFDMHLLSSKTHGTGRVDQKHQAMIKIAAGQ